MSENVLFDVRNVTLTCVDTPHTPEGVRPVSTILFPPPHKKKAVFQSVFKAQSAEQGSVVTE